MALTGVVVIGKSAASNPSAATANSANSLAGQTTFAIRLGFGQSQVIATHGVVSFVANCKRKATDFAEVLYQTSVNGAVANGEDDFDGSSPTELLNADTPAAGRVLVDEPVATGLTLVPGEIDNSFVLGPDGKGLVANTEGIILGLNYGAPGCYIAGVVKLSAKQ
jgi:hypothetical protein